MIKNSDKENVFTSCIEELINLSTISSILRAEIMKKIDYQITDLYFNKQIHADFNRFLYIL